MKLLSKLKLKYDLWRMERRIKRVTQWAKKLSPKKKKYAKEIVKRLEWLKKMRKELQ